MSCHGDIRMGGHKEFIYNRTDGQTVKSCGTEIEVKSCETDLDFVKIIPARSLSK